MVVAGVAIVVTVVLLVRWKLVVLAPVPLIPKLFGAVAMAVEPMRSSSRM